MLTHKEENILNTIDNSLYSFAFNDIIKSRQQSMLIASFALCFCFISALSAHRYFVPGKPKPGEDGQRFRDFILKYFNPKYHIYAKELYSDLRSRLVHNYAIGERFAFTEGNTINHLKIEEDGTVILLIDDFITDIEIAFTKFRYDLQIDPETQPHALDHYYKYNIISARQEST